MLTAQDIKKLASVLATKKEVSEIRKEMATKKDLARGLGDVRKEMVTKKDLARELGDIRKEMVTKKEFDRSLSFLATKQDFKELKYDTEALRESLQQLITVVEKLAGSVDNLRTEYFAISAQLSRHEKWIKEIAEKAGVKLITD